MIINNEYKFIFVGIPKTASTTIHNVCGHRVHPPPHIYHMKLNEILEQNSEYESYFKFCFVRNPYQRFISTWFDLANPNSGHTTQSWNDLDKYNSFEHFVDEFPTSKWVNWVHFRKQIDYVLVDNLNKMDFIGKQENFEDDFTEACKLIGIDKPDTLNFPRERESVRPKIEEIATKYYYDMIRILKNLIIISGDKYE